VDYEGQHIVGVLNLDMIGWNTPESSREMEVHAKSTVPGSLELAQLFAGVITTYGLELIPEIIDPGVGRSDHAAFWTHGYAAILAIEDFSDDFNPNYHKKEDLLDRLDINYFTEMVKAAVGTFAHMSRCQRVTYFPLVVNGNVPQ
jgi:Zn-dependent M28 family amino/carboxypeptidase